MTTKIKVEVDGKDIPYVTLELVMDYSVHYCGIMPPVQRIEVFRYIYKEPGVKAMPPLTVTEFYTVKDIKAQGNDIIIMANIPGQ